MKYRGTRIALFTIEALIGLAALGGGIAILTKTFHFDQWLPVTWLQGSPFSDYTIPGFVLVLVIGGGMLFAAATIFVQREWPVLFSLTMGLVMIGFEIGEIVIIDRYPQAVVPPTIVQQSLMSGLGLLIFGLAGCVWMREYRRHSFLSRYMSHA